MPVIDCVFDLRAGWLMDMRHGVGQEFVSGTKALKAYRGQLEIALEFANTKHDCTNNPHSVSREDLGLVMSL